MERLTPFIGWARVEARDVMLSRAIAQLDDAEADSQFQRAALFRSEQGGNTVGWEPPRRGMRLNYRRLGFRAERAAAAYLGLAKWKRDRDGFGKPDVLWFYVRMGADTYYGLMVHGGDDRRVPHLLVVRVARPDEFDGLHFRVAGWLPPGVGLDWRRRRINGREHPGTTRPWCVDQRFLIEVPEEGWRWCESIKRRAGKACLTRLGKG